MSLLEFEKLFRPCNLADEFHAKIRDRAAMDKLDDLLYGMLAHPSEHEDLTQLLRNVLVCLRIHMADPESAMPLAQRWQAYQVGKSTAFGETMAAALPATPPSPAASKAAIRSESPVLMIRRLAALCRFNAGDVAPSILAIRPNPGIAPLGGAGFLGEVKDLLQQVAKLGDAATSPLGLSPHLELPIDRQGRQPLVTVVTALGDDIHSRLAVPSSVEYRADGITGAFPIPTHVEDLADYVMQMVVDTIAGFAAAHRRKLFLSEMGTVRVVAKPMANDATGGISRKSKTVFAVMPVPCPRTLSANQQRLAPESAACPPSIVSDSYVLGKLLAEVLGRAHKDFMAHKDFIARGLAAAFARLERFVEPILRICLERDASKRMTAELLEMRVWLLVIAASIDTSSVDGMDAPTIAVRRATQRATQRATPDAPQPRDGFHAHFDFTKKELSLAADPAAKAPTGGKKLFTETGELTPKGGAITPAGAVLLQAAGLADNITSACTAKAVAVRTTDLNLRPENVPAFEEKKAALFRYRHPNLVPYVEVTHLPATNKVAFTMPHCNALSLDELLVKLEGSLPHDMAGQFASAVGAQLLLGLAYIHTVHGAAHGNLKPSNILLTTEGCVAMNDYDAVRDVLGAPAATAEGLRRKQKAELEVVARVMYTIAALQPWEQTQERLRWKLEDKIPNPTLRSVIQYLLQYDATADGGLAIAAWTERPFFLDHSSNRTLVDTPCSRLLREHLRAKAVAAPKVDLPPKMTLAVENEHWRQLESDTTLAALRKLALCNAFATHQRSMSEATWRFIKQSIVPMMYHKKAVASSASEWTVVHEVNPRVSFIKFSASIVERFKLPGTTPYGVVKIVDLKPEEASSHALRRAVTIMERGHHPNIVRMLAATRQGKRVHIIFEAEDYGSLRDVLAGLADDRANKGEMPSPEQLLHFFLGIATQLLVGLVFLHEKLGVAHRDLTDEHILVSGDGKLRLCSFGASGMGTPGTDSDMVQLSKLLQSIQAELFSEVPAAAAPDPTAFKTLATFVEKMRKSTTPYEMLQDRSLLQEAGFYLPTRSDSTYRADLDTARKIANLDTRSLVEEMRSWKRFDDANPVGDKRFTLRGKMKDVIAAREEKSIQAVAAIVRLVPKKIAST